MSRYRYLSRTSSFSSALPVDRERQRIALGQYLDLLGGDLDLAGRQLGILVPGRAAPHLAGDPHAELGPQLVRDVLLPQTTWTTPLASRRSMKTTPPWSLRRATQPASVTCCPACDGRSAPASCVRIISRPSPSVGNLTQLTRVHSPLAGPDCGREPGQEGIGRPLRADRRLRARGPTARRSRPAAAGRPWPGYRESSGNRRPAGRCARSSPANSRSPVNIVSGSRNVTEPGV